MFSSETVKQALVVFVSVFLSSYFLLMRDEPILLIELLNLLFNQICSIGAYGALLPGTDLSDLRKRE